MNIGCASAYRSSKLDALHSACSMFLRQNSAINEGGFNNSLRDSRKIFPEDGSVTRSNGATGSLSAENGTCSEPYRYLCGQTDNCMNMEIVSIEKKTFEMMMAAFGALSEKVAALRRKSDTGRMERWLTGEEVCGQLRYRLSARSIRTADDLIYSPTESEVMMNENNDVFTMEDEPIASVMQNMRKGSKWLSAFLESYRPPLDGERYLTDGEVSELLRVSRRTLQEYRNNRVLPFILLGGKVLYPETVLREVLEANYRKPL